MTSLDFLSEGGAAGALMRTLDWNSSPLGAPADWPQSLRSVVGLLLNSRFPMFVAWGDDLGFLYNDAYAQILGAKHPDAMGRRFHEVWPEIWNDISPMIEAALAGHATYHEDLPLLVNRHGRDEEAWFTFSYSPVRDESGRVAGVFCAVSETTNQYLAAIRRNALLELDGRLRNASDTSTVSFAASELLGEVLAVTRVGYGVVDAGARTIFVERNWSSPGFADLAGHRRFADYGTYIRNLVDGETVAIGDVNTDPRTAAKAEAFRAIRTTAFVDVPVMDNGRIVATLFVHSATPRTWTGEQVAFLKDVAERIHAAAAIRAAEQGLRKSEARFRLVADAVPQIVWITDADGRTEFFNKQWSDYTGAVYEPTTAADVAAKHVHPDDAAATINAFDHARRTGATFLVEHRIRSKTGEYRWFLVRGEPFREPQSGQIVRWFGASVDIEDRRQAEAELRALNETLEEQVALRSAERDRLWQLSQDLLARADYSGMMSAVSPAWIQVLGWSEVELLARGYASFMHPDDAAATLQAIAHMAKTGQPSRFENRIAASDGSWKHIEWTVAPEPDGLNFIAVGRDMSLVRAREQELVHTQEQLRQSQKLEAMGQLTGGVAHDFNNLLTPIMGTLDTLVRRGIGSDRERRLIEGALQSTERAKTLVQRLLAFARRQPLQTTAVDVAGLVNGMVSLISSTLGPTIDVRTEVDPDMPPAGADHNQLEMALLNLAVNARDAMPDGGELILGVKCERVREPHASNLNSGDYIRLSVSDTGTGMDEETRRRAIEPFFSTKGIGKGTGLGLSMVHGLAAQLGGGLTINSTPGQGTTIALWLPTASASVQYESSPSEPANATGRVGLALLVDDEDVVRMSTADMLSDLGYEVKEAGSAAEALQLVRSGLEPDLLVTDHLMPGKTGAQLIQELKPERPKLSVLIISGYAEVEGMDPEIPRLTKPFRTTDLETILATLMSPAGSSN
ncbi:PAS domain S-box protein [Devosia sp. RR2S18]|uniref:PAS domain S-box protein n=1 Tax=Devosia rhizosphaerae TaxID=3049774 RepID=UPI0025416CE3|nr:PAS domain S-box protein [Devosia sp. RR2S18]WIJ25089.1 PAS domain S-box protein [Devosia sp. RR2S18]